MLSAEINVGIGTRDELICPSVLAISFPILGRLFVCFLSSSYFFPLCFIVTLFLYFISAQF